MVVLDLLMMAAACGFVFLVKPSTFSTLDGVRFPLDPLPLTVLMSLVWMLSLTVCGTYQRHVMAEGYDLYTKIVNSMVVDFAIVCTVSFLVGLDFPRTLMVVTPLAAGFLTIVERWLMRRMLHGYRRRGKMVYPTVIVGSPAGIEKTIALLGENPALGYAPIAVCPIKMTSSGVAIPDPQGLANGQLSDARSHKILRVLKFNSHLPQTARRLLAQVVLVADVLSRQSETLNAFSLAVEASGMELSVGVGVADTGGHVLRLHNTAASLPVLTSRLPQYTFIMRGVKRTMDIVLSSVAIIIAAIPMLIVAIMIKREDGGPVFYMQERIGLYGKKFKIFKFRSMRVDADKMDEELADEMGADHGILFKPKDDPRITKIGKFIRKTSIDEVPQFFNVFLGTMSLVGPRPQQQYEVDEYSTVYSTRLLVKPGLTGPWQVSGRSDLSQEQAERLDVDYVENWSLTTDIAILLKTVVAVLRGSGSY
ncbi:MAG: sugar transferase [Bifidobacteriaceae bacterium]|jgi:exopolysaccharide biosynthesis polyprenyl glycosylphosphotransferase|nr:sugar transferase [Bifidobacteriaceae bacterium]